VPNPYNPQDLNRFSYVRNNPIRYNDPTGHFCSDPEDLWSPGCDGSGGRPNNRPAPLPDVPVVINNPGPLDDGQEQDDPTPTDEPVVITLDPLDDGQEQDDPIPTVTLPTFVTPPVTIPSSSGPNWIAIVGTAVLIAGGVLILATGVGVVAYGGLMVYAGVTEIIGGAVGLAAIEAFQGIALGAFFTIPSGLAGMWAGGKTLEAATTYTYSR